MIHFRAAVQIGAIEARSIGRDSMLRGMLLLPLGIAMAARWVLPLVLQRIGASIGLDLLQWYPLIVSYALLLIGPIMYGMVTGFLLLDQRDDRTLLALQVTPLQIRMYVLGKLFVLMFISLIVTPFALLITGFVQLQFHALLLAILAAVPLAPLAALVFASFAHNKVQGLALMKALSVFMIMPLLALVVPLPWQLAFGLLPTYWPAQLFWALHDNTPYAWMYGVGAVLVDGALLIVLLRRFERVLYQ